MPLAIKDVVSTVLIKSLVVSPLVSKPAKHVYRKWGKIHWAKLSRFSGVLRKFFRDYKCLSLIILIMCNYGPNIPPWGTPEITGNIVEKLLLIFTHCCLLLRYALNHCQRLPLIPIDHSLPNNLSWDTVSYALLMAKATRKYFLKN